jgi:menaquinone-dependent protoporphyrinogen oxidase
MAKVLVAYASKYGSTGEVAEAIARRLGTLGVSAEVLPVGEVRDPSSYSAVVLGVALYFFRWRHEAHSFCTRHRHALASLPVALFGMGPIEDTPEQYAGSRRHLDKGLTKHSKLAPRTIAVFGGQLDPTKLRFPDNNPGMRRMPPSDLRDWAAIDAWADSLVDALAIRADHAPPDE